MDLHNGFVIFSYENEYDITRIRSRLGGLSHLETFTFQNLTLAERVTPV